MPNYDNCLILGLGKEFYLIPGLGNILPNPSIRQGFLPNPRIRQRFLPNPRIRKMLPNPRIRQNSLPNPRINHENNCYLNKN